jgi:hypothetical protein
VTTAESPQLAAIKARHEDVRDKINDPALTVGAEIHMEVGMSVGQTGLASVMVDKLGRLWRFNPNQNYADPLVMIFDPSTPLAHPAVVQHVLSIASHRVPWTDLPDPDDTQATHGFKAHE